MYSVVRGVLTFARKIRGNTLKRYEMCPGGYFNVPLCSYLSYFS